MVLRLSLFLIRTGTWSLNPEAVRNELEIVYVSHMDEVLDVALSSSIREKVRKITVDSYNTFSDAKYAIQN